MVNKVNEHSILNLEPLDYSEEAISKYKTLGNYTELLSREELHSLDWSKITTLVIRLAHTLNRTFLSKFPSLKHVITPTTGLNHIDLEECRRRDISVYSLRGHQEFLKRITSTPELTWGLLLALIRHIPAASASVKNGEWERDNFRGIQLNGKTLGIVGLGRIGQQMAEYARVFGMKVCYFDPFVENTEFVRKESLEALMAVSDFLSIHVHLSDETRNMINRDNVESLKPGAFILNSARGEVMDESALIPLLENGHIAGIAVDVLVEELVDIKKSPLYKACIEGNNVLITPHIGGATFDAMHICEEFMANQFLKTLT